MHEFAGLFSRFVCRPCFFKSRCFRAVSGTLALARIGIGALFLVDDNRLVFRALSRQDLLFRRLTV